MRAMMIAILMLPGCATVVDGQRLQGVEWRAIDINGAPIVGPVPVTLRLEEGGRATGNTSCNIYNGNYRLTSRQSVNFEALATTRRGCEPVIMDQERRYLSILENVRSYSLYRDGSLSLISPDGRAIRFRTD